MDVVQLTTHIDATAVQAAVSLPESFADKDKRDAVAARERANTSSAALLVLFDGNDHCVYDLGAAGTLRIGRSITADVQLEDPMVSRKHAVIELTGDGARVLDDRSLNGVVVNDEPVSTQCPLRDGDEVRIANFVLRVVLND